MAGSWRKRKVGSVICAATLMTSAPLLVGFLLFQRQFVQSFMRAGIR
jgi:sn-glycerol 3-phosphate transport system permease protein